MSEHTHKVDMAWSLLQKGHCADAETLFINALESHPSDLSLLLGLGQSMMGRAAWADAIEIFILLIEREQTADLHREYTPSVYTHLAECYYQLKDISSWLSAARQSLTLSPPAIDQLVTFAQRLSMIEQYSEALRHLNGALRLNDRSEIVHRTFAEVYLKTGDRHRAIQSLSAVAAINPHNAQAINQLSELLNQRVPTWHFPMMNDLPRNEAFEKAIIARLEPGDTVLDIGCGAGLLSLMAARAGAEHVIAIESEPEVADAAEEIFKLNGYEDRIRLIRGRSTSLQVGVDLPRRANLLVSEIFDVSLLGEDALNTFRHAQEQLLTPQAKVIPAQARVWCALVESDELRARYHVDDSCGFDLSVFNRLRDPRVLQLDLGRFDYQMLTAPTLVAHFDFESPIEMMGQALISAAVHTAGRADGFIFWYDLVLAPETEDREEIILSTAPEQENTHWLQGFSPCYGESKHLEAGSLAQLLCGYRRFLLWLQLL